MQAYPATHNNSRPSMSHNGHDRGGPFAETLLNKIAYLSIPAASQPFATLHDRHTTIEDHPSTVIQCDPG